MCSSYLQVIDLSALKKSLGHTIESMTSEERARTDTPGVPKSVIKNHAIGNREEYERVKDGG